MTEFELYFEQYYAQAIGYTCKKITNAQDAEDLVMETFYACYKKMDAFDKEKASFGTWFYVALNNRIKNYYRDSKEYSELDPQVPQESSFEEEIAEAAELTSMRKELANALKELNETQRKIVILSYFKEKKSTEIAEIMGMTPGNVRVTLNRAISKMKVYFGEMQIKWEG